MNSKIITVFCSLIVAGLIVGASLPVFATFTASSETVHNEGAGWLRFDLNQDAGTTYDVNISWDENGYYVANGSNVQAYDDNATADFETILYADSNVSVWTYDGDNTLMLGKADGSPVYVEFTEPITISRDSEGVVISDGTDSYAFAVPEWAYIPWSGGSYGFFAYNAERGVTVPNGTPTATVGGGFAGVYAYNDILRYDGLGLEMNGITEDGLYYGAEWVKATEPTEGDSITIVPLEPSVINPGDSTQPVTPIDDNPIIDPFDDPDAGIMAVPTPTYTEGDWGYDIIQVDGVDKAVIVSYSGTGGNVIVPATIGGYDVYRLGKSLDSGSDFVFDNNTLSSYSTLTISDGIKQIGRMACYGCSHFVGPLVIPGSVTYIGNSAFNSASGFTGSLVIPEGVTSIGGYAFSFCQGLTGPLVIPEGVTSIGAGVFSNCTSLTGPLVIPEGVTSIGESVFNSCRGLTGPLVIPEGVTSIGNLAFHSCSGFNDVLVIPNSVISIGTAAFYRCDSIKTCIVASDSVPLGNTSLGMVGLLEILDLSDVVDYSINRYGMSATATVSDSIGDTFGFIGAVDYTIGGGTGSPTQQLIALLPVVMIAGLVLFSIVALAINRK